MIKFGTLNNIKSAFSPKRQALSKVYLEILARVLNELHATSYSLRFWTFLLHGYVGSVISNLELYEQEDIILRITNDYESGFGKPSLKIRLQKSIIAMLKYFKTLKNKKRILNYIRSHSSLHIGFPKLKVVDDDLGQRLPLFYPFYQFMHNRKIRDELELISQKYDDIVVRNMLRGIPKIYIEGLPSILVSIPKYSPKEKIFHYHMGTGYFLFLVAIYLEHGAKLYWYQHGAFYGEMEYGGHVRERDLADVYRTWGWKIEDKDEPWKAYRLEDFRSKFDISTISAEYDLLMAFGIVSSQTIEYNINFAKTLFKNLDKKKYQKILVRPRPTNKLFSSKNKLNFLQDSRISFSTGLKPMYNDMAKSKLTLQMYIPSTNFLECLYVQYPTVGLLDNDQPTQIVKLFYNWLIEKRVLHISIRSLVSHLNKVDVNEWWQDVINDPEYAKYKNQFFKGID